MKHFLLKQLNIMLNALEAQHFGEFRSDFEKVSSLNKILAGLEHEQYPQTREPKVYTADFLHPDAEVSAV